MYFIDSEREFIMANTLTLLVIEDDDSVCGEYARLCSASRGIILAGVTNSSQEGLELTKEKQPDAVVLDLELHNGSGNGLLYLSELQKLKLGHQPYVMVVTNNISAATHSLARKMGADFIITKSQTDYSVSMVLSMLQSISACMYDGKKQASVPDESDGDLDGRICSELDRIGINPKHKGRQYLREAIALICERKQPNISAVIAKRYSTTSASVERAMQHAINRAWKLTDIDTLITCYTARINPAKGVPTTTEFIYYYAEKIVK